MRVASFIRPVALISTLFVLAGCSTAPQRPADMAPTPPSITTPTTPNEQRPPVPVSGAVEGFYSWDSRTGDTTIDEVLIALAGNDVSLDARLQMVTQPCPVAGVNGPLPCESGKENGTPLPVFRYLWCDPTYLTPAEATRTLHHYLATSPQLYAAYQLKDGGPVNLGADSAILMAGSLGDPSAFLLYLDKQGQILAMQTGCGKPGAVAPKAEAVTYLLPPLAGQEAKDEQAAYITGLLQSEGAQMLATLRFATGETDCYGLDCSKPVPLTIAQALQNRCNKIGPESLRQAGGYDPAQHGALLDAFASVCSQATEVANAAPPPSDEAILAVFESAKSALKANLDK